MATVEEEVKAVEADIKRETDRLYETLGFSKYSDLVNDFLKDIMENNPFKSIEEVKARYGEKSMEYKLAVDKIVLAKLKTL